MHNRQVAHLWANQSQESAKGNNFYFNKNMIFSYGSHFMIARIEKNNTIFFTKRKCSRATRNHLGWTYIAIDTTKYNSENKNFIRLYDIDNFEINKNDNLKMLESDILELYQSFLKSRIDKEFIKKQILREIMNYNNYKTFLKRKPKNFKLDLTITQEFLEK